MSESSNGEIKDKEACNMSENEAYNVFSDGKDDETVNASDFHIKDAIAAAGKLSGVERSHGVRKRFNKREVLWAVISVAALILACASLGWSLYLSHRMGSLVRKGDVNRSGESVFRSFVTASHDMKRMNNQNASVTEEDNPLSLDDVIDLLQTTASIADKLVNEDVPKLRSALSAVATNASEEIQNSTQVFLKSMESKALKQNEQEQLLMRNDRNISNITRKITEIHQKFDLKLQNLTDVISVLDAAFKSRISQCANIGDMTRAVNQLSQLKNETEKAFEQASAVSRKLELRLETSFNLLESNLTHLTSSNLDVQQNLIVAEEQLRMFQASQRNTTVAIAHFEKESSSVNNSLLHLNNELKSVDSRINDRTSELANLTGALVQLDGNLKSSCENLSATLNLFHEQTTKALNDSNHNVTVLYRILKTLRTSAHSMERVLQNYEAQIRTIEEEAATARQSCQASTNNLTSNLNQLEDMIYSKMSLNLSDLQRRFDRHVKKSEVDSTCLDNKLAEVNTSLLEDRQNMETNFLITEERLQDLQNNMSSSASKLDDHDYKLSHLQLEVTNLFANDLLASNIHNSLLANISNLSLNLETLTDDYQNVSVQLATRPSRLRVINENTKIASFPRARSCRELKDLGFIASGLYEIFLRGNENSTEVYCDMEVNGGGWTLVASLHGNNIISNCSSQSRWANNATMNWKNDVTFGEIHHAHSSDYKSRAYCDANASDVMIWHVPSDVTFPEVTDRAFLKYYTSDHFLLQHGTSLRDFYSETIGGNAGENVLLMMNSISAAKTQITGLVSSWFNYAYDGGTNSISDGGNDMYDTGNKVTFEFGGRSTSIHYGSTYDYSSSGYAIKSKQIYPFTMIAWIGANNARSSASIRVISGTGADGGGSYTSGGSSVSSGNTFVKYKYFQVYNANDPSICEVYFAIGKPAWGTRTDVVLGVTWSSRTDPLDNSVRFTNLRNVLLGYMLLSRSTGSHVSNVGNVMRKLAEIADATNQLDRPVSIPVNFFKGSTRDILTRSSSASRGLINVGYTGLKVLDSSSNLYALCPGVRVVGDSGYDYACVGKFSTNNRRCDSELHGVSKRPWLNQTNIMIFVR